jgi:hypothetical protein
MAYIRVISPTWFEYHPLRVGDILEVTDELAAQWKRIGVGRDSNKSAFEAFEKLREEDALDAARQRREEAGTGQSAEDRETERRAQELEARQAATPMVSRQNVPGGSPTAPPAPEKK